MAWNELLEKRGRGSKVFQDSADPTKHSLDMQTGTAWHYASALDGVYDQEVDLTPERVLAGGHDGWRVTNNGWHYFVGQPDGLADGFVGFGGRGGNKWLLFRLLRVGYLHWPTRAFDDIGGAPDYDRANLSQETRDTTVDTTGQTIPVETIAAWSDLWNTPGGGALGVSWRADGNRLKEEITINQAARTWIGANRPPATPASETYFSFVFRLGSALDINNIEMDLSHLAKWLKNGVEQDTGGDFDDDDGTQGIEVRNTLDEFLFFLPISKAWVTGDEENPIKLRKRIYKDGSDYYLLVGAKVSDLAGLPVGDLVFDPTIDEQVGASADDAFESASGIFVDATFALCDATNEYFGMRWSSVTIPDGATIDTAYIDTKFQNAAQDEPWHDIFFEDGSSPAQFDSEDVDNISTRTTTTASVVLGDGNAIGVSVDDWLTDHSAEPEIKTIIQELVDTYDYSGGAPMVTVITLNASASGADDYNVYFYDNAAADAPKLHIEYTAGGTEYSASVSPVATAISLPAVTATYVSVLSASVSPVATAISLPAVTATYVGELTASVSPVTVPINPPAVTATSGVEYSASVSPVTTTINLPAVAATYASELSASVSPVAVPISLPAVTATSGSVAVVSPVTITVALPGVTATYVSELSAVVSAVMVPVVLPEVTATGLGYETGKEGGDDIKRRPKPSAWEKQVLEKQIEIERPPSPTFQLRQEQQERIATEQVAGQLRRQKEDEAARRVERMLAQEKADAARAEKNRITRLKNLELAKMAQEEQAKREAELNKVRRKNLRKARRAKKRKNK